MSMTENELRALLDKEPDTKLKKKLLEAMEPEKKKLADFDALVWHVIDLLTETLGERRIKPRGRGSFNGRAYIDHLIKVGHCRIDVNMCLEYLKVGSISIGKNAGREVEIRLDPDNPEAMMPLVKMTVDFLNGENND